VIEGQGECRKPTGNKDGGETIHTDLVGRARWRANEGEVGETHPFESVHETVLCGEIKEVCSGK